MRSLWILSFLLAGCTTGKKYDVVPDSILFKSPNWTGGIDYKVRFEERKEP